MYVRGAVWLAATRAGSGVVSCEAEALKLNSSSFHTVTVLFSAVLFQLLTSGGSSRHMTFQPRLDGSMPPPASQTLRCPTHLVFCRIEI